MAHHFADIGNTRIKIAKVVGDNVVRVFHGDHALVDKEICSSVKLLSNVGMSELQKKSLFGTCLTIHDMVGHIPLTLAYQDPMSFGQDRLAAMMGAWGALQKVDKRGILAVLDAGSCVTIDVLDNKGCHLGGNIDIGLQWRLDAVHDYADNLPLLDFDLVKDSTVSPHSFLAANTKDALAYGIVSGFLRQQQQSLKFCIERYGVNYLYITGGLGSWINSFLAEEDWAKEGGCEIFVDEDLVIRGLSDIFAHE
tara:strand:+ start:237 stop:992 length:756 start_codon:yes stop_codon:yes gene_type:complete